MTTPQPAPAAPNPPPNTLHHPRILCLHGGGTNALIFHAQCRVLRAHLSPYFRLVFASAPFPSQPGPDVVSVYQTFGPFLRWLRWLPSHPPIAASAAVSAIDASLAATMRADDALGASGDWVGVLGFSQGAKVAASLLLRQQRVGAGTAGTDFRFGVVMAGRGPLVAMEAGGVPGGENSNAALVGAGEIGLAGWPDEETVARKEHVLRVPTVHVHGSRDAGLEAHRGLVEGYCAGGTARVVLWEGEHRVPVKRGDVEAVVGEILGVARETGVFGGEGGGGWARVGGGVGV